jgi:ABC-2 type transport system ATP-binding protein
LDKNIVLKLDNVWFRFNNKSPWLFTKLNSSSRLADRVVVQGRNGVGKTTLLRCIMGTYVPTKGKIIIPTTTKIGVQLQQISYPEWLKVKQIATFFGNMINLSVNEIKKQNCYKYFRIDEIWSRVANSLSNGQKRRFNLMLSFINHPNLILLDEPTAELDKDWTMKTVKYINNYLRYNKASLWLFTNNENEIKLFHIHKRIILNGQ